MRIKALNEQEQKLADYVASLAVNVTVIAKGETKRDDWQCDAWEFVITRVCGKVRAEARFDYFTGIGHREKLKFGEPIAVQPPLAGLLYSLAMGTSACEQSFKSWCDDFGYSDDSIKALDTYRACQENADKLARIFSREEIAALAAILEDY